MTHTLIDIAFVCDCTGSMGVFMEKIKDTIKETINEINAQFEKPDVHVGIVGYRDHGEADKMIEKLEMTSDTEAAVNFANGLVAYGGSDPEEAVVDGLDTALHLDWRKMSIKNLVLILDNPPHGFEFQNELSQSSILGGCPCRKDYKKVLKKIDKKGIKLLVLNFRPLVHKMINIFQKFHSGVTSIDVGVPSPQIKTPPSDFYSGVGFRFGDIEQKGVGREPVFATFPSSPFPMQSPFGNSFQNQMPKIQDSGLIPNFGTLPSKEEAPAENPIFVPTGTFTKEFSSIFNSINPASLDCKSTINTAPEFQACGSFPQAQPNRFYQPYYSLFSNSEKPVPNPNFTVPLQPAASEYISPSEILHQQQVAEKMPKLISAAVCANIRAALNSS